MGAVAEAEVGVGVAGKVEAVRISELRGVAVSRGPPHASSRVF